MSLLESVRRPYDTDANTVARAAAVPEPVAQKLAHLVDLAEAARAGLAKLTEKAREARGERLGVQARLDRARQDAGRHRGGLVVDTGLTQDERVRKARGEFAPVEIVRPGSGLALLLPNLEAEHAVVVRECERIAERIAAVQSRVDAAGRLANRCVKWLRDTDTMPLAEAVATATRDAAALTLSRDAKPLIAELAKIRLELSALHAERHETENAGVTLTEARARAMEVIAAHAAPWELNVGRFFSPEFEYAVGSDPVPSDPDGLRAVVVSLLLDTVRDRVNAALEREAETRSLLLSPDQRAQRLAIIDGKARAAGLREELAVLRLEAAGLDVLRREDADPAIVLVTVDGTPSTG